MRLLEIILPITLALRLIYPKRWNVLLPVSVFLLHLIIEGYRWQLIPLYTFTLIGFPLSIRELKSASVDFIETNRQTPILLKLLGSFTLIIFTAPPTLFPIPKPPAPTGPYNVGTTTFHLTDASRTDPYAPDPASQRELVVQIWYPADELGDSPAPWMEYGEIVSPAISDWIEMPTWFLDHLKYATTDSFSDIPVSSAEASFPVLLFSHGFGGFRAQNTFQMQELASHGYIVVAPEHTYASVITVFPDGHIALHNPDTLPDNVSEAEYDLAAQRLLVQWTADLGFVLDTLEILNVKEPLLLSKLDLSRVGVFGHSTGGGTTVQFCAQDTRCKAGLGMDVWLIPVADEVITNGPKQPFLFLYSEAWPKQKNMALFDRLFAAMGSPVARFTILGTSHYDFTDLPALSPLAPYIGLKGPLNGKRVQEIINTYSLTFFDSALKGKGSELWKGGLQGFEEVVWVEEK